MSYEVTNQTLAELNERHRALRHPNLAPSALPQPGAWHSDGEAILPTPAVSQSVRENGSEAHVPRFRIHHEPIKY